MSSRCTITWRQSHNLRRPNRLRSATRHLRSCSRTSVAQPRHPAYKQPARLVRQVQARPSELWLLPRSSVSSNSTLNYLSEEETPDWTFRTNEIIEEHLSRPLQSMDSTTNVPDTAYEMLTCKRKPGNIRFKTNEASAFNFRGPIIVESESEKEIIAGSEPRREKKICRQLAVDLTSKDAERKLKQSSFDKSSTSLPGGKQSCYNSRQLSSEKTQKSDESSRPKFSRSATLEWTFEGPSSHVPSSDWIDSFTRQHGLASRSDQRRSSYANCPRSSLDNPRTTFKHRTLSKSPSAPTQDLNYRSIKDYGSTNSSFEHHPSDPIPFATETRVLVHNVPSFEGLKKHQKSSSWSKKLGITSSQFLSAGWTGSSKRSPTFPLISPSSGSQSSSDRHESRDSDSTVIEMTVPRIDFSGSTSMRNSASETSWVTGNRETLNTDDKNPVRRRLPVTKLHRSPSRSSRLNPDNIKGQMDTVVQVNPGRGNGWLSIARNQRAKIKKCKTLGKLYTTVRVEDDDISVLVSMDWSKWRITFCTSSGAKSALILSCTTNHRSNIYC